MILGYVLSPIDNDLNIYENIILGECDKYKNIYEINKISKKVSIKNGIEISCSYDGFTIVSDKFKKFCESEKYTNLEFIQFQDSPKYFWFKVNNILEYDSVRRGTEFINYSEKCKGYSDIIGADPACLKRKSKIEDGFFRTDLFFGSNASKSPLYIIGIETRQKLINTGFKNVYFEKILDKYSWED